MPANYLLVAIQMRVWWLDKMFSSMPVCLNFNADYDPTMNGRDPRAIPPYRVFPTNGRGRIVAAPQVIEARDDDDAIRAAQELTGSTAAELWRGVQRIALLNGSERKANRPAD